MVAAAVFGRFGATKDNSPEAFEPGVQIEGAGPGKRASRHSVKKPKPQKTSVPIDFLGHQSIKSSLLFDAMTKAKSKHGRCTDWIRENRRRRAAGLPQFRVGPFSEEWWRLRQRVA